MDDAPARSSGAVLLVPAAVCLVAAVASVVIAVRAAGVEPDLGSDTDLRGLVVLAMLAQGALALLLALAGWIASRVLASGAVAERRVALLALGVGSAVLAAPDVFYLTVVLAVVGRGAFVDSGWLSSLPDVVAFVAMGLTVAWLSAAPNVAVVVAVAVAGTWMAAYETWLSATGLIGGPAAPAPPARPPAP